MDGAGERRLVDDTAGAGSEGERVPFSRKVKTGKKRRAAFAGNKTNRLIEFRDELALRDTDLHGVLILTEERWAISTFICFLISFFLFRALFSIC